jgi:hypothetical protein
MYCSLNTFLFAHQRGEETAIVSFQMIMISILINELANTEASYCLSTHNFTCHSKPNVSDAIYDRDLTVLRMIKTIMVSLQCTYGFIFPRLAVTKTIKGYERLASDSSNTVYNFARVISEKCSLQNTVALF